MEHAPVRHQRRRRLAQPLGNRPSGQHFGHIGAGFGIGRDTSVASHGPLARIINRQYQNRVFAKVIHQPRKIGDACFDILCRVQTICDTKAGRSGRHQLHQPLCASMALGGDLSRAFD